METDKALHSDENMNKMASDTNMDTHLRAVELLKQPDDIAPRVIIDCKKDI